MDESEAYNHGQYDTYEEALAAARKIVEEFFEHNLASGVTADNLMAQYCLYGEDPIIVSNDSREYPRFSARDYAREVAESICKKQ